MKYPFSAITERGSIRWPDDAKVALIVTLNLEHWDMVKDTDTPYYAGGPPILPNTLPAKEGLWKDGQFVNEGDAKESQEEKL